MAATAMGGGTSSVRACFVRAALFALFVQWRLSKEPVRVQAEDKLVQQPLAISDGV
jgi:hypothetical protein